MCQGEYKEGTGAAYRKLALQLHSTHLCPSCVHHCRGQERRDGRRQVGGFYLPGDIFGLEFRDEHTFSAEAITDTKVIVVKRSVLMVVAGRNTGVSRELMALTACELGRAQNHVLLLVKSAEQRVAHFLLEMAERARGGNVVELPMVR